jgi:hypothetical protein
MLPYGTSVAPGLTHPQPDWWRPDVNRVAEMQFLIRPQIEGALKAQILNTGEESIRAIVGDAMTYFDLWERQRGPQFFDMSTLVRLASTVETLMRTYYRTCLGRPSISQLSVDRAAFQRFFPWSQNNVMDVFFADLGVDLAQNPELPRVQRLMCHRHLYAHSSGLVTDEFLRNWQRLTCEDLRTDPSLAAYPAQDDVYFFRPLKELDAYIEDVRRFFRGFPVSS